jgi:chromate reductase
MATIVAIAGSVRAKSFNQMLLRAAIELAPAGTTVEAGSIEDIPLYNGDLEAASGSPAPVEALKDRIAKADGVLLVTPEYNNSLPGVFKNAIDWTSRPPADMARVWGGRPIGVIGATPGPGGTGMAQAAWLPVLRTLGMRPWFEGRLLVPAAAKVFDTDGRVADAAIEARISSFIEGFTAFVDAQRR